MMKPMHNVYHSQFNNVVMCGDDNTISHLHPIVNSMHLNNYIIKGTILEEYDQFYWKTFEQAIGMRSR